MAEIIVDISALNSISSKIRNLVDDYDDEYREMIRMVTTMAQWSGVDSTAFKNSVRSFTDDFAKIKRELDEYASFIQTGAKKYKDAQSNAVKLAKKI